MFVLNMMFSGSIVALVTPFKNGELDLHGLEKIITFHLKSATEGILIVGSTGEGLLLSASEKEKLMRAANDIIGKKIPLIIGCSTPSTSEAIALAKQAEDNGADGILSIVPYYIKPTQQGIIRHFSAIHEHSNLPIIMYNNPGRCAVNAAVETIIEACGCVRIVALKDSDTDQSRVSAIKKKAPKLSLLSGDDLSLAGYIANGGDGAISVTANVAPNQIAELIQACKNGDMKKVHELNYPLTALSQALFLESNPIPVKYALHKLGLIENELRQPLMRASARTEAEIDFVLKSWTFT